MWEPSSNQQGWLEQMYPYPILFYSIAGDKQAAGLIWGWLQVPNSHRGQESDTFTESSLYVVPDRTASCVRGTDMQEHNVEGGLHTHAECVLLPKHQLRPHSG